MSVRSVFNDGSRVSFVLCCFWVELMLLLLGESVRESLLVASARGCWHREGCDAESDWRSSVSGLRGPVAEVAYVYFGFCNDPGF